MFVKRILTMLMALALMIGLTAYGQVTTVDSTTIQVTEIIETEPTIEEEYKIQPEVTIETQPKEIESEYIEKIPEVPLYNQLDYYQTLYGDSTISRSGCGITCYAMVLSYLLDREILPDELVTNYHKYKVEGGSAHALFLDTQEEWGVTVKDCHWMDAWIDGEVMKALENGQPIIANVHEDSAFTDEGHFIVLYGLTQDGKILVRDPNGANYDKNNFLMEGFANGFEEEYFKSLNANYFIYGAKDIEAIAKANK